MIAALPKAPSRINPITSPERAVERRNYVLGRMHELGYIDQAGARPGRPGNGPGLLPRRHRGNFGALRGGDGARAAPCSLLGSKAYTGGYRGRNHDRQPPAGRRQPGDLERAGGIRSTARVPGCGGSRRPERARTQHGGLARRARAPYRPVSGLEPGLVIEAEDDIALVFLRNGQTIALALDDMKWAAPFISRDRKGKRPRKSHRYHGARRRWFGPALHKRRGRVAVSASCRRWKRRWFLWTRIAAISSRHLWVAMILPAASTTA